MASVNKRRWTHKGVAREAWVVRYTDGGGKRRMKTFDLKKEADKYRLQAETEIEKGIHVATTETARIGKIIDQYLSAAAARVREGRQMGHGYLRATRMIVTNHIVPHLGGRLLSELTFGQVEEWINGLTATGRLKPVTVKGIADTLKVIVDYAIKRGFVSRNVVAEVLRERRGATEEPIRTFTKEQVITLLRVVDVRPMRYGERAALRLRAYVHVAAFCGLRWGEITGLTLPTIDFDRRLIRVRHNLTAFDELKAPKTRAGIRDVPMPEHVAGILRTWIEQFYIPNSRQVLFQNHADHQWGASNFHAAWKKLLARAGLPACERQGHFHFHALRHFAASFMIENGLPLTDVAAILGHSKFDMTLQVYAHPIVPGHRRLEIADRMATGLLMPPAVDAIASATTTA